MSSDSLDYLEPDSSEAVDSDYESVYSYRAGDGTTSVSLASAVTDYKFEYGRRYHAYREGTYPFPNDEQQAHHMDLAHHSWLLRLKGELHLAPLENPQSILDLGTGTGIWVLEMAEKYPKAMITGNDLSPIQPLWVQPNVTFEVDDFNAEWTYQENSFDFVHARSLYGSVDRWQHFLSSAFKVLRPNGWFESMEVDIVILSDDGTLKEDNILNEWVHLVNEASEVKNRSLKIVASLPKWMEEVGFVNIQHKAYKVPLGPWPKQPAEKEVGYWNLISMTRGVEGFTLALFTRNLGWSAEDALAYSEKVVQAMGDKKLHSYIKIHFSIGQKPPSSGESSSRQRTPKASSPRGSPKASSPQGSPEASSSRGPSSQETS